MIYRLLFLLLTMILRLEHIGIAVNDPEKSQELFDLLLDRKSYKSELVDSEGVKTIFYKSGESKIELVASASEENAIQKYLEKKGEGIHHLAFEVDDIYATMLEMEDKGFQILNKQPKRGADNKLIFFLHPKSTNGVLIEFCQSVKEDQAGL